MITCTPPVPSAHSGPPCPVTAGRRIPRLIPLPSNSRVPRTIGVFGTTNCSSTAESAGRKHRSANTKSLRSNEFPSKYAKAYAKACSLLCQLPLLLAPDGRHRQVALATAPHLLVLYKQAIDCNFTNGGYHRLTTGSACPFTGNQARNRQNNGYPLSSPRSRNAIGLACRTPPHVTAQGRNSRKGSRRKT